MKNTITAVKSNEFSESIQRWAQEDMLQLAHHFHRLNNATNQFERTSDFIMNKEGDVPMFESIKKSITRIRTYMALDEANKESFTFFPVMEVLTTQEITYYFKLHAAYYREPKEKSEVVSELFKNMIGKNWDTIDLNLIDDLFAATVQEQNGFDKVVRVKYYEISKDIIEKVIHELPEIKGISVYSGIDMNKFGDKRQISFTPVFGFQYEEDSEDISGYGLKSIIEFSKGEVLIEYTSPCPPTCEEKNNE